MEQWVKALPTIERVGIAVGMPREPGSSPRPFEHPYYWAAFILAGDPGWPARQHEEPK
jgi:hypothetical protein